MPQRTRNLILASGLDLTLIHHHPLEAIPTQIANTYRTGNKECDYSLMKTPTPFSMLEIKKALNPHTPGQGGPCAIASMAQAYVITHVYWHTQTLMMMREGYGESSLPTIGKITNAIFLPTHIGTVIPMYPTTTGTRMDNNGISRTAMSNLATNMIETILNTGIGVIGTHDAQLRLELVEVRDNRDPDKFHLFPTFPVHHFSNLNEIRAL